jgi:glycosyltransferase involved in cell wall biosynthesis
MNITNVAKICIISPSLKLGGIERALTTLAEEFHALGHEVYFIACLKDKDFYTLPKGIQIFEPNFKRSTSKTNKLLFYPRLLRYIRQNVRSIKPDKVLVFGDWFSPVALLALYGTKYPVYISDRTIPDYKFSFPIPQLKKWLYPKSAGFIAQTKRAKHHKLRFFGSDLRMEVIPNALPIFTKQENTAIKKEQKLIYVGRFAWEKDPEILIRAMQHVALMYPNWKLEMAGSGPLLDKMEKIVIELGLQDKVIFLGNVSDVASLYQSASLLVLPSVVEGFPNTLIEAMSFGLPTICFADIPYEDIVEHKVNGLVVNKRTPEVLAGTIAMLLELKELREKIGLNASQSVEKFDKTQIAQRILDFMKIG